MLEAIVISVTLVLFFGLLFFGTTGAKKRRKVEVARLVEPLGFEIINKVIDRCLDSGMSRQYVLLIPAQSELL
jgi:hypothetical protein